MAGFLTFLRRHLRVLIAAAVLVSAGLVFVLLYFEPQKLIFDDTVNEPPPAGSGSARVLSDGRVTARGHPASGTARVLELDDGSRVLRLERLDVENGPDLRVLLTEAGPKADDGDYRRDVVDLGALQGNQGDQNYALPADVRLDRYRAVVIWCRRFTYAFASAPL